MDKKGSRIAKNGSKRTKDCVLMDQKTHAFCQKNLSFSEIGLGACKIASNASVLLWIVQTGISTPILEFIKSLTPKKSILTEKDA